MWIKVDLKMIVHDYASDALFLQRSWKKLGDAMENFFTHLHTHTAKPNLFQIEFWMCCRKILKNISRYFSENAELTDRLSRTFFKIKLSVVRIVEMLLFHSPFAVNLIYFGDKNFHIESPGTLSPFGRIMQLSFVHKKRTLRMNDSPSILKKVWKIIMLTKK